MNNRCIACLTKLEDHNRSREHVIPEALGGRKTTNRSPCRQCNNETGAEWDAKLVEQLLPIQQLVHDPAAPRVGTRTVRDNETGVELTFKPGFQGGLTTETIVTKLGDNKIGIQTSANTSRRARQELEKALRERGLERSEAKKEARRQPVVQELREQWIEATVFSPWGADGTMKATVKTAMNCGCVAGLGWYQKARGDDYLRGRDFLVVWLPAVPGVVEKPAEGTEQWCHTIYVRTDASEKVVWGYCEWFGVVHVVMLLGRAYLGTPRERKYSVDPTTGQEVDTKVNEEKFRESVGRFQGLDRIASETAQWRRQRTEAFLEGPDYNLQPLMDWRVDRSGVVGKATVKDLGIRKAPAPPKSTIHEVRPSQPAGHHRGSRTE